MVRVVSKALGARVIWLPWAAILIAAVAMAGCTSNATAASESNRKLFEKRVGADESKAKAFVDALGSMPFGQRDSYAKDHPAEVRNMALIPDPVLQTKFRNLMTNRG